jgi:hypothetical protein
MVGITAIPRAAHSGNSAILSLLRLTLQKASEVFDAYRFNNQAMNAELQPTKLKMLFTKPVTMPVGINCRFASKKNLQPARQYHGFLTGAFPESTNKTELVDRY